MTDIITSMLKLVQTHATLNNKTLRQIEKEMRSQFGGEQAYIAKRAELIESKRSTINRELIAGRSIAQIERMHDIPRSTIYRIINTQKHRGIF